MDVSSLRLCMDLRESHIAEAASSSEAMQALLARFEQIAEPSRGGPLVLLAFARLATTACDWLDGELRIELVARDGETVISTSQTIGGGFREKVFRDFRLRVPLVEFTRGIDLKPELIAPLTVRATGQRIVLTATNEVRRTTLPPAEIPLDASAYMHVPKLTIPFVPEATSPAPAAPPRSAPASTGRSATVIGLQDRAPKAPRPGGPKLVVRRRTDSTDRQADKK